MYRLSKRCVLERGLVVLMLNAKNQEVFYFVSLRRGETDVFAGY